MRKVEDEKLCKISSRNKHITYHGKVMRFKNKTPNTAFFHTAVITSK